MSELLQSLSYSASGMQAQATRLRHVSENISNADTPGYHRKLISFQEQLDSGQVTTGPVSLDQSPLQSTYDPSNPLADDTGHFDGSNVDLVTEMADAREAQRSYEANLRIFDQARTMTLSLFELLKR
ncbi:flagellar basal body rod protein FlgC [Fuscibacter oryzae]|uniref:Flagellar basal body rod protein FlgC n=1 Tax=Fuscibacter oryzae TaxID=2803939 RepID=A0A8J7MRV0_9RHOB|nr:flagellar basal body rod protein FlgC [Fuscibacter oryzae]MBL4928376.1 flagellar basal body rod protein FlgC [Fuscibacter oryzae]